MKLNTNKLYGFIQKYEYLKCCLVATLCLFLLQSLIIHAVSGV